MVEIETIINFDKENEFYNKWYQKKCKMNSITFSSKSLVSIKKISATQKVTHTLKRWIEIILYTLNIFRDWMLEKWKLR